MKHLNITIKGRVQRVGFRFCTMEAAYKYGVTGVVMNKDDNSIYIEAEGEPKEMDDFLEWCRSGPLGAKVEEVTYVEGELKEFTSFEIKSRAKWLNTDNGKSK